MLRKRDTKFLLIITSIWVLILLAMLYGCASPAPKRKALTWRNTPTPKAGCEEYFTVDDIAFMMQLHYYANCKNNLEFEKLDKIEW